MKQTVLLIFVLIIITSFTVNTSAVDINNSIITINNTDIIFDVNSTLTNDEMLIIAESIVYGASNVQTYGLICNIFGHKNTTEYVTTITHCVRNTAPRCLNEKWELLVCSRCDNVEETRIAYSYMNCCPED